MVTIYRERWVVVRIWEAEETGPNMRIWSGPYQTRQGAREAAEHAAVKHPGVAFGYATFGGGVRLPVPQDLEEIE